MVLTERSMKLSKEQKAVLIEQLNSPWGHVQLMCDGYRINLNVERCKGLSYRVVTYVNGEWKGVWCQGDKPTPEHKFLNRIERPLAKPSEKAKMEKIFGKRAIAKDPWFTKTLVTYDVSWPSGKAAINHLCRVCDSVELFEPTGSES
jgi:hypothetical protein